MAIGAESDGCLGSRGCGRARIFERGDQALKCHALGRAEGKAEDIVRVLESAALPNADKPTAEAFLDSIQSSAEHATTLEP